MCDVQKLPKLSVNEGITQLSIKRHRVLIGVAVSAHQSRVLGVGRCPFLRLFDAKLQEMVTVAPGERHESTLLSMKLRSKHLIFWLLLYLFSASGCAAFPSVNI